MREFKFRVWLEDEKNMVYKYLHAVGWVFVNERDPVMQYTGYKDKNGKDIYEGDILKHNSNLINVTANLKIPKSEHTNWYEVFWNEKLNGWMVRIIKTTRTNNFGLGFESTFYIQSYMSKSEVIGNIYENPELIKELK